MEDLKYEYGKIYRLVCNDGYYYIGSTRDKLNHRFNKHIQASKTETSKVYQHINNIGRENVKIELIEEYPCASKKELNERENFYIKQYKNDELCLNCIHSHTTKEERKEIAKAYYESHKEEIKEQHKKYFANPEVKEKADEYQANYRKENAEKRRAYTKKYSEEHPESVKAARKSYYEENKEVITQKNKAYVEKNKEAVNQRKRAWAQKKKEENAERIEKEQKEKKLQRLQRKIERKQKDEEIHTCECGGTYQLYRKSRHDKGKKHIQFFQEKTS